MQDSIQIFKSLGDETRLRILHLLSHQELCVCQLTEVLGLGQSKISRHLAHLRNAGLVSDRRQGLWIYYSLVQPQGRLHQLVVDWLRQVAEEIPNAAEDLPALLGLQECEDLCSKKSEGEDSNRRCSDVAAVGV